MELNELPNGAVSYLSPWQVSMLLRFDHRWAPVAQFALTNLPTWHAEYASMVPAFELSSPLDNDRLAKGTALRRRIGSATTEPRVVVQPLGAGGPQELINSTGGQNNSRPLRVRQLALGSAGRAHASMDQTVPVAKGSAVLDPSQARYMPVRSRELSSSKYYEEVYTTSFVPVIHTAGQPATKDDPSAANRLSSAGPTRLFSPPSLAGIALLHNQLSSNIDRYLTFINGKVGKKVDTTTNPSVQWAIPLRSSVANMVTTETDLSVAGRAQDARRACVNNKALRDCLLSDLWAYLPLDDRGHLTKEEALKHFYAPILGTLCFDVLGGGESTRPATTDGARSATSPFHPSRVRTPASMRGISGGAPTVASLPQVLQDAATKDWFHRTEGHRTLTVSREQFIETMLAMVDGWCQSTQEEEAFEMVKCFSNLIRWSRKPIAALAPTEAPNKEAPLSDSTMTTAMVTASLGTRNIIIPNPDAESKSPLASRVLLPLEASVASKVARSATTLTAAVAPPSAAFATGSLAAFVTSLTKGDIPSFEVPGVSAEVGGSKPPLPKPTTPPPLLLLSPPKKDQLVTVIDEPVDWSSPQVLKEDRGELSVSDEDSEEGGLANTQRPDPEAMAAAVAATAAAATPLLPSFESPKSPHSRPKGDTITIQSDATHLLSSSIGVATPIRHLSQAHEGSPSQITVKSEAEALEDIVRDFDRFVGILHARGSSASPLPVLHGQSDASPTDIHLFSNSELGAASSIFKALPEDAGDLSICRSKKITAKGKRRQSGVSTANSQSAVSLMIPKLEDTAVTFNRPLGIQTGGISFPPPPMLATLLLSQGEASMGVSRREESPGPGRPPSAPEGARCGGHPVLPFDILYRRRSTVPIVRCLSMIHTMRDGTDEASPYIQWMAVASDTVAAVGTQQALAGILRALSMHKPGLQPNEVSALLALYLGVATDLDEDVVVIEQSSCVEGTSAYWSLQRGQELQEGCKVPLQGVLLEGRPVTLMANFKKLVATGGGRDYLLFGVLNPSDIWFEYSNETRNGWRPVGTASDLPKRFINGPSTLLKGGGLEYNQALAPRSSSSDESDSGQSMSEAHRSAHTRKRLDSAARGQASFGLRPRGAFNSMLNPAKQPDRRKLVDVAASLGKLDAMGENKEAAKGNTEVVAAIQAQCGQEYIKAVFREKDARSPRQQSSDARPTSEGGLASGSDDNLNLATPTKSSRAGRRNVRNHVSGFALPEGTHVHGVPTSRVQHTVQIAVQVDNNSRIATRTAPQMLLFSRAGLSDGPSHSSAAATTLREASAVTSMIATDEARTFKLRGSERTYSRFNTERNAASFIAHKLIPSLIAHAHHERYHMSALTTLPIRGSILIVAPVQGPELAVRSDVFSVLPEDGSSADTSRSKQGHDPRQTILLHRLERRGKEVPAKLRQPTGPDAELILLSGDTGLTSRMLTPNELARQVTATVLYSAGDRHEALLRVPMDALACGLGSFQSPSTSRPPSQMPQLACEPSDILPEPFDQSGASNLNISPLKAPLSLAPLRFSNDNFKVRYDKEGFASSEPTVTLVEVGTAHADDGAVVSGVDEREYEDIRVDTSAPRGRPLSSLSPAFSSRAVPIGSATYSDMSNYGPASEEGRGDVSKRSLTTRDGNLTSTDTKMRRATERLNQSRQNILVSKQEDTTSRWRAGGLKASRVPEISATLLPSVDNPRPQRKGTGASLWGFGQQKF